ncbi:helix-turn-helix domain-containing protein [Streptomyces sp. M19]
MPEPQRGRLADTLLCWLQCGRNANEAATRMNVHPQTVRYRLRRLEELFGDRLRDASVRFELELVLRVEARCGGDRAGCSGRASGASFRGLRCRAARAPVAAGAAGAVRVPRPTRRPPPPPPGAAVPLRAAGPRGRVPVRAGRVPVRVTVRSGGSPVPPGPVRASSRPRAARPR